MAWEGSSESSRMQEGSVGVRVGSASSQAIARGSVFTALIAVGWTIGVPMPPPLSTLNAAMLFGALAGVLLGPRVGIISTAGGSLLGFLMASSLGMVSVPPGFIGIFTLGALVARGPQGLIVGAFRGREKVRPLLEASGMTLAVVYEAAAFFLMDWYLFGWAGGLFSLTFTLVDLVWVPVGVSILLAVRGMLNVRYLD